MSWISICDLNELTEGQGKFVLIDGFGLAVFLHQGKIHVMDDLCPHAGGDLSRGTIEDGCVLCPWHRWPFELETGQMPDGSHGVRVYPTRIHKRPGHPDLLQADLPRF